MKGTPKTLGEAIQNGFVESGGANDRPSVTIEKHVIDFIAQKFSVAFLEITNWREGSSTWRQPEEIIEATFEKITGRKVKNESEEKA